MLKWAGVSLLSASLLALLALELLLWLFSPLLLMLALVLRGAESETRGSSPGKWWCIEVQGR